MAEPKDFWDKLDILLRPLGAVLAGAVIVWLGFISRDYLEDRQRIEAKQLEDRQRIEAKQLEERQRVEANQRLLADLISNREKSESALRKDMFAEIIKTFLTPASDESRDVLNIEILAYNFHEVLDLGPLFKAVYSNIRKKQAKADVGSERWEEYRTYLKRLEQVAGEVIRKQTTALERDDNLATGIVRFEEVAASPKGSKVVIEQRILAGRGFQLEVLDVYEERKELDVKLSIWSPTDDDSWIASYGIFRVGFFDFPMIDNTRLSGGMRCAVVLTKFKEEQGSAELALIYFHESRASLKEKPYYEEVIKNLLDTSRIGVTAVDEE
ncbi:MAG: hypothetical protein GY791_14810 [Alphaproteobacteria bacterium]|nr:hypothetical protein [Alphaproteobacteria bacterium]